MTFAKTVKIIENKNVAGKILYAGDDDLDRAAVYLATILFNENYAFDYIPSYSKFPDSIKLADYALIIFSDYPRNNISDKKLAEIADYVKSGGAFLMIGGWESFTGLNCEYNNSDIENILPVRLSPKDDRVNYPQGILVLPKDNAHYIAKGLNWNKPAVIGGFNRFEPIRDSETILVGKRIEADFSKPNMIEIIGEEIPLLVINRRDSGIGAALAFDLAPHWVGGFVDWGDKRKKGEFNGGFIETGDIYWRFVSNLISFLINKENWR